MRQGLLPIRRASWSLSWVRFSLDVLSAVVLFWNKLLNFLTDRYTLSSTCNTNRASGRLGRHHVDFAVSMLMESDYPD